MFCALTRLFAKAIIEPKVDADGKRVYPDLNKTHDAGLVVHPEIDDLRLVERTDAVVI